MNKRYFNFSKNVFQNLNIRITYQTESLEKYEIYEILFIKYSARFEMYFGQC